MAGCKVIGIYGGAGSGKSEVTGILKRNRKAYVIKADDVAHTLYRKGQRGYKAITRVCGKRILDDKKQIDRKKLAKLLFEDRQLLTAVNSAIHPMVYFKTRQLIEQYKKNHKNGLIVFEAALLPDTPLDFTDTDWYIHTDSAVRCKRMQDTRGYSDERVQSVLNAQPSDDEYRRYCDLEIENNGTLEELEENTDEAIKHCQRQQR